MAYQVILAAPMADGAGTEDAGLAFEGNLYETEALAEYLRAKRYGLDDCWSFTVEVKTIDQIAEEQDPFVGPLQEFDDIPF